MPDEQTQPTNEGTLPQWVTEARQALETITQIRGQAQEQLKQIELSRKNADSEALYAFNAKTACEGHATTIAGFKGTVEADSNAIATNKQRSDEALAALNSAKASVDSDVKVIEDRRKEADQANIAVNQATAKVTATSTAASEHLNEIAKVKESADNQLTATSDSAKAAADALTEANSARDTAVKASTDVTQLLTLATQDQSAISQRVQGATTLLEQAQASEEKLKTITEHLAQSDETAIGYEQRLKELTSEVQALKERVEGLLPGATSAGLASSFNKQRLRFSGPQIQWLWTFVACIALLVVLAVPSFFSAMGWMHQTDESWNATWRSLTMRLPIVLPVIWLAIYAGRNYMLSLRMEEDYAYKEAVSTAFEGYKREMETIGAGDAEKPTPITILCTNILRAIAERPGRIYEGKQEDINLLTEIQALAEKGTELSKKKLARS